jgi:hypothetical protein
LDDPTGEEDAKMGECGSDGKKGMDGQDWAEKDRERLRERMEGREGVSVPEQEVDRPSEQRVDGHCQCRPSLPKSDF